MGLSDGERQAYQAHIKSLEEMVAHQRGVIERAFGIPSAATAPQAQPPLMESKLYLSEEEEEIQELQDEGLIDAEEAQRMLEAAGALHTEVEFAPKT